MPDYSFIARDMTGRKVQGHLNAKTERDLDDYFLKKNWTPVSVTSQKESPKLELQYRRSRINDDELIAFTRQLSTAYAAGISVAEALEILATTTARPCFQATIKDIVDQIRSGSGLTEAFSKHPAYFSQMYLSILRSGEISGNLESVLEYVADLIEKKLAHRERIRSALLYPKLVIAMVVITMIVIVSFVIPQFAQFYDKFQAQLPLPTRLLLQFSQTARTLWWAVIAVAVFGWWGSRKLIKIPTIRILLDRMFLRLPIFGSLFLKIDLAQFCTLYGILLRSGILITDATTVAVESIHNRFLQKHLSTIVPVIRQGGSLGSAMKNIALLPPFFVSMVTMGEQSGRIDPLLQRVAHAYERETDAVLRKLPIILEPILLGILFGLVLFLALAIYLPLWKMAGLARTGIVK